MCAHEARYGSHHELSGTVQYILHLMQHVILVLPPVQELLHVVCWVRSSSNLGIC